MSSMLCVHLEFLCLPPNILLTISTLIVLLTVSIGYGYQATHQSRSNVRGFHPRQLL